MHHLVDHPFDMDFERTVFSDETYSVIGRALAYAQKFEGDCKALRGLVEAKTGKLHRELFDDDAAFTQFVNAIHKQCLHKQIKEIVGRLQLPGDIDAALQTARQRRNEIAHEMCLGIQWDIETDDGRKRLVDEMSRSVREIAEAHQLVLAIACALTREDLPAPHYLNSYCDRVVEWVCSIEE